MDAESGSRALCAVSDLVELLGLAQGAADRVEKEVHGASYEEAELISRELHRVRRLAERLKNDTAELVSREESQNVSRGHPLRRASDHRGGQRLLRGAN
jgi:hypothetical protein